MAKAKDSDRASIRALKGAERVRERPGVMFGSDNLKGAFHTFKEIVGNALDECRGGYGKTVEVVFHADNAISVRDRGRGVPMEFNEAEKRWDWDLVFNELYAGGKYDETEAYKFSVGLNGLGAAAVQYTSEYFLVDSYRDGYLLRKTFTAGFPDSMDAPEKIPIAKGYHYNPLFPDLPECGTLIKWKVDPKVFRNTAFTFDMFREYCVGQAHINNVTFILADEHTASGAGSVSEPLVIEGKGIEYYLSTMVPEDKVKETLFKRATSSGKDSRGKDFSAVCELCMLVTDETESARLFFHNTADMTCGVHTTAVHDALTGFFKAVGKKNNVTIMPYDYQDYLSVIVSSYSNITSFANQTKDGVDDQFIYDIIKNTVTDLLEESVAKQLPCISTLMQNVVNAALARKKAKEIEAQERQLRKATTGKRLKAEKYVDCRSNDPAEKELFIVEGDSALGSCKNARDSKFQALLPVRGKTLNCLKASIQSVIGSQVIKDIIITLGCGVDLGGKFSSTKFDIDECQFSKIILTTDADVDGYQIRVLLYTIFYKLMPELLRQGRVYVAETPLFEIELGRGESLFAYTVEEKEKILKDLAKKGKKYKKIHRSKGLGENTPDMLWHTTMCPESRRLVQLTIDPDDTSVQRLSEMLFGKDQGKERNAYIDEALKRFGLVDLEIERQFTSGSDAEGGVA